MIKQRLKQFLQWLLGYENYLFCFAVVQVVRIRWLGHDRAFLHFIQLLPEDGIILDIGANIGINTVVLAKARPHCSIHAFEPLPQNTAALSRIMRFFQVNNVKIRQMALGNENGTVNMLLPLHQGAYMQGWAHVITTGNTAVGTGRVYQVPVCKLDGIVLAGSAERITGIKMDVENFEWYVLQGGKGLFQQYRPILFCELWKDERKQYCIDLMQSLQYSVHVYEGKRWVDYAGQDSLDYLFLPHQSSAETAIN